MTDPSWLLATMAQSAAAIVAIVGGFLVSRVVALSSERQGLERRARELEQQTLDQAARLQEVHERRQDESWERLVKLAADKCAERRVEHGSVSPEWVVEEYWVRGVPTREEMLDLAGLLVEGIQQASKHFERGGSMPDFQTTNREDYSIYEAVRNARPQPVKRVDHLSFSGLSGALISPESDGVFVWKQTRYEKLIDDEREQRTRLSLLERERDFVQTEAARVAKPQGLWLAAAAFAYLTMVGVVVPVVGLAWRPVPFDLFARRVLVSLFVSGLSVVGCYLIWAIWRLSRAG